MAAISTERPRIGRFELRREIGRGAQATVWLAWDERLEREVAVKLMHPEAAADPLTVGHWLGEARHVSRLTHPHIVPVFEADLYRDRPYLVFEYVPGPTLAQHLGAVGALPPHEAVVMAIGVLDALSAAHDAGVVHRDLKPSNILVDAAGRARVMDFGIAARLRDPGAADQVVGTPGYMSPEAAEGAAPTEAMDVFSTGLVLIEMLTGRRLLQERDPYRAIARVCHEDLSLPEDLPAGVDDPLRNLLRRAIERDPKRRWPDAKAFRQALQQWLRPVPAAAVDPGASPAAAGALEFLLRRMRHRTDFPALSDSVSRIQRCAESENESIAGLSSEILKDVALTQKLLRLVNTAHYASAGGNVSTVSRAIALIGFAGVRNLAISLVLLEHMHDKAHAAQLRENFLRSLMAGMLASELAGGSQGHEEAFIGAMLQNLGRMLCEFYFPEEAQQVRGLLASEAASPVAAPDEDSAAVSVLGIGFQALGLGVAKIWGLPDGLQACIRTPTGEPPSHRPTDATLQMRWLTLGANRLTDAILAADAGRGAARVADVARKHARVLGSSVEAIEAAVLTAQARLAQLAQAMSLHLGPGSVARRLLQPIAGPASGAGAGAEAGTGAGFSSGAGDGPDSLSPHQLQATVASTRRSDTPLGPEQACEMLAAGIQDITNSMVEDFKLNQVLRMVLETMWRALAFRRVVFCLRDPKTETLTGRFGLGDGVERVVQEFKVPLVAGTRPHLFTAVCLKGADMLISDASQPGIADRLPEWFVGSVRAPSFLLLPLQLKRASFGLIYADRGEPGGYDLSEKELALLRTLRNQAVMAFRQVS